jgi:hypothetical protein
MATMDRYAAPVDVDRWDVPQDFTTAFRWEYADGREALTKLYGKGKQRQWDADTRIDWSQDLDPENPEQLPDESIPIAGSDVFRRLTAREKAGCTTSSSWPTPSRRRSSGCSTASSRTRAGT